MFNLGKVLGNPPRAAATLLAIAVIGVVGWQLITTWLAGNRWEENTVTASQLLEQGRFAEGERHLEDAVEAARQLGPQDPRFDQALTDLAEARTAQGKTEEVVYLRLHSLQSRVQRFGQVSPQVAEALADLGDIYLVRGEFISSEGMYNQAIDVWERLGAARQIDAAKSYYGRGRALHKMGKLDKAQADAIAALEIQEAELGKEAKDIVPTLLLLAKVLEDRGLPEDAERIRLRMNSIRGVQPTHRPIPTAAMPAGLAITPTAATPAAAPTP